MQTVRREAPHQQRITCIMIHDTSHELVWAIQRDQSSVGASYDVRILPTRILIEFRTKLHSHRYDDEYQILPVHVPVRTRMLPRN